MNLGVHRSGIVPLKKQNLNWLFFFYCIVRTTSSQNKKYMCKNIFYKKKLILSSSIYFYCIVRTNSSLIKNCISKNICYQKKTIDLVPFIFFVYYFLLLERKVSLYYKRLKCRRCRRRRRRCRCRRCVCTVNSTYVAISV